MEEIDPKTQLLINYCMLLEVGWFRKILLALQTAGKSLMARVQVIGIQARME